MNGGLRRNGSVSHRSSPAHLCGQQQQQIREAEKAPLGSKDSFFQIQDGQVLPGVETPGELSGWQQQQQAELEKKSSRDEIHSNESYLSYSSQESSKESYLSYNLADNHTDSRLEASSSNTELATFPRQKRRVTILASSPPLQQPSPV